MNTYIYAPACRPWLNSQHGASMGAVWRRIYTTFILGTALLHVNFGTRANNIGHGTLGFCRAEANFSARVSKNLGCPRPPQEVVSARLRRGPRTETRGILVSRVMTDHESQGSGVENLVLFAGGKMASKNKKNSGTIRIWSNDATDRAVVGRDYPVRVKKNSETLKETRELYSTLQVSNTFYLI